MKEKNHSKHYKTDDEMNTNICVWDKERNSEVFEKPVKSLELFLKHNLYKNCSCEKLQFLFVHQGGVCRIVFTTQPL